jgi:hypothetical protein
MVVSPALSPLTGSADFLSCEDVNSLIFIFSFK